MSTKNRNAEAQRAAAARHMTSPLWGAFVNGMSSVELAAATGGRVSRITAAKFLESAVIRGAAVRKKVKGVVHYWRSDEAPAPQAEGMAPMRPLRESFPGRRIIPVRAGGVVVPVNYSGSHYEVVGDRGARA